MHTFIGWHPDSYDALVIFGVFPCSVLLYVELISYVVILINLKHISTPCLIKLMACCPIPNKTSDLIYCSLLHLSTDLPFLLRDVVNHFKPIWPMEVII